MRRPDAGPLDLRDLVHADEGSVASHVFLRNAGGTVTVFAFGRGEGLSEHATPHDALVQSLEGEVRLAMEGEEHTLRPGEMLYIPPNVVHTVEGGEPFKMVLTILRNEDSGDGVK